MGFLFTVLYLAIAYATPSEIFGSFADLHIEIVIVILAVIFSLPNILKSRVLLSRQAFAVIGLSFAVFLSVALTGWFGGAIAALYGFMQAELAFFLVAVNCTQKRHFQIIVLSMFLISTCFIVLGAWDLYNHVSPSIFLFGEGTLRRVRGLGFVNDPNDFAQAMVSLIPALFLFKRRGNLANAFLVGLPLTVLLIGLYLTHSRGGIVALAAVVLVSARRKMGTIPAGVLAVLLFAGALAVGWSGGRDVSMDAGADRLDLWAAGLDMIKAHPLFGVGIGGFADANGITAHNSVVICAAETGILGLFFWTMLQVTSFRDSGRYSVAAEAVALASDGHETIKRNDMMATRSPSVLLSGSSVRQRVSALSQPMPSAIDVRGMLTILVASLTGFLTAGWFLSRAISMWLFMYCGMLYAARHMAEEVGVVPEKESLWPSVRLSLVVTFTLLAILSIILRLRNFGH